MDWTGIAAIVVGVGSPMAALIFVLRWLIKRQADGNWILASDHDKQMADKDKQIAGLELVNSEIRATAGSKDKVIAEQATALKQSTDSARYIDLIVRRAFGNVDAETPLVGDNVSQEA